jgi:hypothetical protein
MTGQIIPFQTFRYREEAPAHQGPARDNLARPIGSQSDPGPRVQRQVARITQLLDELEELAQTSNSCPPAIVGLAQAGIERARRILRPCSESERTAGRKNDIEDDPQPDVDGEMMERMYRKLNPDA